MKTETLSVGQKFTVPLDANVQSGYMWYVDLPDIDENVSLEKTVNHLKKNFTGTIQSFHFVAVQSGEQIVKFVYKRSWETLGYKEHFVKFIVQ